MVSANEYTSRIGMDILEAGGNAVDAAVAMIFANSLTEPGATSLGGASFMTIYLKETGEYICIEAMETAPAAAGIDTLDEINEKKGAMLVTVPGQVHGALTALEKYGTMTREEVQAHGLNYSLTHVDFMVGTADLSIVGTTHDGREIPVFINGNFAI